MNMIQLKPHNNINFKGSSDLKQSAKSIKQRIDDIQSDNDQITKTQMAVGTGAGAGVFAAFSNFSKNAADTAQIVKKSAQDVKNDNVLKALPAKITKFAGALKEKGKLGKVAAKAIDNKVFKKSLSAVAGIGAMLILGVELVTAISGGSKILKDNSQIANK